MLHKLMFFISLTASIISASSADARTLTAVCNNIVGRNLGFWNGELQNEKDGIRGASFVYSWEENANAAQVITQSIDGNNPQTNSAIPVTINERMICFLVTYPESLWTHCLYPAIQKAIITKKSTGYAADTTSAVGYLFKSDCKIGVE